MELKCKKLECKYNTKYACNARAINVTRKARCETFEEPNKQRPKKYLLDISRTMFEASADMKTFKHNKSVKVTCEANCIFNEKGDCNANGISVLKTEMNAFCGTQLEEK